MGARGECQRVLTVGKQVQRVSGGVLERGEGRVLLEALSEVLGGLIIEVVVA